MQKALENELGACYEYCGRLLSWIAGVEYSVSASDGQRHLLDYTSFAEVARDAGEKVSFQVRESPIFEKFTDLSLGERGQKQVDLPLLWQRMNEASSNASKEEAAWVFLSELYRQSGR